MTILFMGTPDFAVPSLEALIAAGHTICGVFTQPDRPKNRGMKLQAPPVKRIALAHDIPVFQPVTLKDGTALEEIRQLSPELIVVAAYGRLLPRKILELPAKGCINVHSSLLPKYRGLPPSIGRCSTGRRRPVSPSCIWPRSWMRGTSSPRRPPQSIPKRRWSRFMIGWPAGRPAAGPDSVPAGGRNGGAYPPGRGTGHLCAHAFPGALSH